VEAGENETPRTQVIYFTAHAVLQKNFPLPTTPAFSMFSPWEIRVADQRPGSLLNGRDSGRQMDRPNARRKPALPHRDRHAVGRYPSCIRGGLVGKGVGTDGQAEGQIRSGGNHFPLIRA
jgi:hypothetical protein